VHAEQHMAFHGSQTHWPTDDHTHWVSDISVQIARVLGLDEEMISQIAVAAEWHDIGKRAIPEAILLKPGKLSAEEWVTMCTHTTLGAAILAGQGISASELAQQVALCHHERWDGRGYPAGLTGSEIPLAARIVAVADVFDALIHERCYKSAWPIQQAVMEIKRCAGGQFDPQIVAAFLMVVLVLLAEPDTMRPLLDANEQPPWRVFLSS
jgi:putative two-component system response regulator